MLDAGMDESKVMRIVGHKTRAMIDRCGLNLDAQGHAWVYRLGRQDRSTEFGTRSPLTLSRFLARTTCNSRTFLNRRRHFSPTLFTVWCSLPSKAAFRTARMRKWDRIH